MAGWQSLDRKEIRDETLRLHRGHGADLHAGKSQVERTVLNARLSLLPINRQGGKEAVMATIAQAVQRPGAEASQRRAQ